MSRALLGAAFVIIAAVTAGSARVHACSCAMASAPCAAEWTAEAIFVGEAINVNQLVEPDARGSRRVTFAVREWFKGVDGPFVDVITGSGGGDCGFGFVTGSAYLVFANRNPTTKKLSTGICSKTALLSW